LLKLKDLKQQIPKDTNNEGVQPNLKWQQQRPTTRQLLVDIFKCVKKIASGVLLETERRTGRYLVRKSEGSGSSREQSV